MRVLFLAMAGAIVLAGCSLAGGGGKATLVSRCVKDGNDKKACQCMADNAEKTLDKEVFAAMVLGAEGKDEEAQAAISKLPLEKQFTMATFAMDTVQKCGINGAVTTN